MLTDIKEARWEETVECEVVFDDGHFNGFGFPCDEDGKILDDLPNPQAYKNYQYCLEHPEKFVRFNKVIRKRWRYKEPGKGKCKCGNTVVLVNEYMGACQCDRCGQWYNLSGQELLDPEYWGWDGTPMEEYW